mgnify:CR=1 FL=1
MGDLQFQYQYKSDDLTAALQLLFQELSCLRNFISVRVKDNPVISQWDDYHVSYTKNKYLVCCAYINILKCFPSIKEQMEKTEQSILIIQDKFEGAW